MYDAIIVGAGAAGIMCASAIKMNNSSLNVLLLEKNDKLGKKLSMTGNGRCNLGNLNIGSKVCIREVCIINSHLLRN